MDGSGAKNCTECLIFYCQAYTEEVKSPIMKESLRLIPAILTFLLLVSGASFESEGDKTLQDQRSATAVVITCKGLIDDGLYKSIRRRTELALSQGTNYIIYEIQTYGGLLESADDIAKYLILDVGKRARTVAYITTEAISAGALISVSCQDIIMRESTTIGDCAPITVGTKLEGVEREKAESFTRAAFMRAAEANGYPALLLKAMVTMQTEVYRVKNLRTDNYEFFETEQIPADANEYDIENKELIVSDDELLTLTASRALEYGIARAQVEDLQGVLQFLQGRDGVTFVDEPIILETNWSEEMVRWLNSPAVMAVLVMLALLGVYIEFSTPGFGLPGLAALLCFAIIIGSKYLVGLANWVEIALFVVGVLLLMIEIFVLPGFGIAGTLGIACMLAGVFGMLIKNPPDRLPWPETSFDWRIFLNGVLGLSFGFIGFAILAWILARYLPKMQFLSGLILTPGPASGPGGASISITASPESGRPNVNVGDVGEVISILRPTGKAKFGDAIVDVVATAEFLGRGTKVEIIEIHGNRVVVKRKEEQS
jgi:membrane-bound serine protease (ClpP class)